MKDRYSRTVAWLKILLPLMALGILSTIILIARVVEPAQELRFTDVDVAKLTDQQMIGNPVYFGVSRDGVAIQLAAMSALQEMDGSDPNGSDRFRGRSVRAEIDIPQGDRIEVYADSLAVNVEENTAAMIGNVRIESSGDVVLVTEGIRLLLDAAQISSDELTELSAPVGEIVADSFEMVQSGENGTDYILVFRGNVKVLFKPIE